MKKLSLLFILTFSVSIFGYSQNSINVTEIGNSYELDNKTYTVQKLGDESFIVRDNGDTLFLTSIEQMPEFKGGQQEMFKFLGNNMIYPVEAKNKGIEGTIYVSFVVNKDGVIKDVEAIKGKNILLKTEAERVVKLMPAWIPGYQKGKAVSVYYLLPIKFTLRKDKKKKK